MYFITLSKGGMLGGIALGPSICEDIHGNAVACYGRFEDAIDAFIQIFDGDNGGWLLAWTFGNMCSIAVFNYAGSILSYQKCQQFLFATAALEVQMLVSVCVCVSVTRVTTVLKR